MDNNSNNAPQDDFIIVNNLKKYFDVKAGFLSSTIAKVRAVDGVSFTIARGESFGLVGESGCGKTTLGQTLIYLNKPTSGEIIIDGVNVNEINKNAKQMRSFRRKMQIIFQDPYSSLNPRLPVSEALSEPLLVHKLATRDNVGQKVAELLELVGLKPYHAGRYPHEFSGGQRQRIGIARALAVEPEFIVCDEPVSALDVSIQAQILNILSNLKKKLKLTYLFISHDLSVVRHISDRVGIMYLGKIVEIASEKELFENPMHPYTKALLSAVPVAEVKEKKLRMVLGGDIPSPINPPSGCRFHERCPNAMPLCSEKEPLLDEHFQKHFCACHLFTNKL